LARLARRSHFTSSHFFEQGRTREALDELVRATEKHLAQGLRIEAPSLQDIPLEHSQLLEKHPALRILFDDSELQ
jgi:hypothetical protein